MEITTFDPQLIKTVNQRWPLPFLYTGTALLSFEGTVLAKRVDDITGKCLGGGVIASRDLEWMGKGSIGEKPGDYIPQSNLFGVSKEPQSVLPSEWIAFEFGIILRGPFGTPFLSSWDDIQSVAKVREQKNDLHLRIDGNFNAPGATIFMQANRQAMQDLMTIAALTGVPVFA